MKKVWILICVLIGVIVSAFFFITKTTPTDWIEHITNGIEQDSEGISWNFHFEF